MLKGLRAVLWVLKRMLLLFALGALILWPWGFRRTVELALWRCEMTAAPPTACLWGLEAKGGNVTLRQLRNRYGGKMPDYYLQRVVAMYGSGWHWNDQRSAVFHVSAPPYLPATPSVSSWGPLRWITYDSPPSLYLSGGWSGGGSPVWQAAEHARIVARGAPFVTEESRSITLPCWLASFCSGVWPVTSLLLMVRRRRRARWLARAGHCRNCGYDLRATPEGGGELLAVCPECGAR
jgi:hypothetical protein